MGFGSRTHVISNPKHQSGVALISTLLVFAIAAILTSQMIRSSQASIQRTQWIVQDAQSWQDALGGEALTQIHLQKALADKAISNKTFLPSTYPTSQGNITTAIEDLQSRINLNNIVASGGHPALVRRLFQQQEAVDLLDPLQDWIDRDHNPTGTGGEDSRYSYGEPSYRVANRQLNDRNQLEALAGAQNTETGKLKSFTSALPVPLPVNINTAPAEVLSAIAPQLDGEQIVQQRSGLQPDLPAKQQEASADASQEVVTSGFQSVESFLQSAVTAGIELDSSVVTVKSHWYAIAVVARFGERKVTLYSRYSLDTETEKLVLWDRTSGLTLNLPEATTTPLDKQPETSDEQSDQKPVSVF
ncbi:type II secretion system minor pseudopilin GspK [Porticoccus sp. W117]|uniref:type II secretion system minor pseudopilin GspK n=1 Tax=Porticoccus sp. W117 TaxID=3054777 RepID=UPI00259286BF|nr:type II secretion system minor pseudopilin GspK [Porticoccus sp. W117]MDM3872564.1 type II secretion system minor pseudopilin GspK [Porticoccus sp. W117]